MPDMLAELRYIADSPSEEYGGFHQRVVDAAKWALGLRDTLQLARQWMKHHDWCAVCRDYMNDSPNPEDHPACTCGAEVAFSAVIAVFPEWPDGQDPNATQRILAWRKDQEQMRSDLRSLRAKLAEVESERDKAWRLDGEHQDKAWRTLAAEQADNARLREALKAFLRWTNEDGLPLRHVVAITEEVFHAEAALAQSPSSNAALREVCGLVAERADMECGFGATDETTRAAIVDAILGPEVAR